MIWNISEISMGIKIGCLYYYKNTNVIHTIIQKAKSLINNPKRFKTLYFEKND